MIIYCCNCQGEVNARLTSGKETYPHRTDLFNIPFWMCDSCCSFVGCHHKTKEKTKPLGVIPSKQIKEARKEIHNLLDPIWKTGRIRRADVYGLISRRIGKSYHTAEIRTHKEALIVIEEVKAIRKMVGMITI